MMQRIGRVVTAGVFAAVLMMPAGVEASVPVRENVKKARELRAQAEALFDQPKEWRKVARLMEESAMLRSADDPEKYECLLYAGRTRANLGDMKSAQRLLGQAAEAALARGAVVEAAQAYVDAAFSAQAAKDVLAAATFAEKARVLATSPLITEQERVSVISRVG